MIERNEGGLCYELNSLFYFFLSENGYNAKANSLYEVRLY
ncbi:arylamine N-acetyltransferase [Paenibacillus sp. 8b26]